MDAWQRAFGGKAERLKHDGGCYCDAGGAGLPTAINSREAGEERAQGCGQGEDKGGREGGGAQREEVEKDLGE